MNKASKDFKQLLNEIILDKYGNFYNYAKDYGYKNLAGAYQLRDLEKPLRFDTIDKMLKVLKVKKVEISITTEHKNGEKTYTTTTEL